MVGNGGFYHLRKRAIFLYAGMLWRTHFGADEIIDTHHSCLVDGPLRLKLHVRRVYRFPFPL